MELSPQSVASTTFKTVKKGYDPDEVRVYLAQLATAIENTQTQAAAMEARARAAVARLQELAAQGAAPAAAPASTRAEPVAAAKSAADLAAESSVSDEAHTISRTLLLAQRTADATIAEAEADAKRIREEADTIAKHALDSAKEVQSRLVDEAKAEARRASEDQRVQIDSEVQSLLARREFLLSDVEHLEQHVINHRDRLREVSASLTTIVESVPGGLAELRRPLMSAVTKNEAAAVEAAATSPTRTPAVTNENLDPTMPLARIPGSSGSSVLPVTVDSSTPAVSVAAQTPTLASVTAPVVSRPQPPGPPAGGDQTPHAGAPGVTGEEPTAQVTSAPRIGNDLFSVNGEELR